jgi:uncharacterized protein (DUF305 family)
MKYIILIIVFSILLLVFFKTCSEKFSVNPCKDYLSDKDYLIHMIPHHQVAVDMCNLMIPISKSKTMQNIYRTIIWNQKIEILFMKQVLNGIPLLSGEIETTLRDTKFKNALSQLKKSEAIDYICDPLFFKPNDHSAHMNHMKHTDLSFLEHMIPHHQVALDMSYRLLEHTNNTHMIKICYEIIVAQRAEILKMNYILDYIKKNNIEFLPNFY